MRRLLLVVVALVGCRWQELVWQPDYVRVCVRWEEVPVTVNGQPVEPWRVRCLEWVMTRAVDTVAASCRPPKYADSSAVAVCP